MAALHDVMEAEPTALPAESGHPPRSGNDLPEVPGKTALGSLFHGSGSPKN